MRRSSLAPGTALIWKELLQLGSRRQTYLTRMVYAGLLFLSFLVFFANYCVRPRDPLAVLGRGRQLFDFVLVFQFGGIYVFLPALVSGTIVEEKDRGCFHLLVLSRLRPWQILAGKLLGRTVPVLTLLLLSLPLLAIAYAYGGLSLNGFVLGIFFLGVACFQVGSASLCASAFFQTPTSAFLGSYALTAALGVAIPLLDLVGTRTGFLTRELAGNISLAPLQLYFQTQGETLANGASRALPALGSGLLCLVLARLLLFRGARRGSRAGAPWRPLDLLGWIPGLRAGGRSDTVAKSTPGGGESVLWREAYRLGVGDWRHQLVLVVLLELLVVTIAIVVTRDARTAPAALAGDIGALSDLVATLWILTLLCISVVGVTAFLGEASRRTLDVLLATPLDGDELVFQKYLGIQRFLRVLWIPFASVFILELVLEFRGRPLTLDALVEIAIYAGASAAAVLVFSTSAVWLAMWIGLRSTNPVRALLGTLVAIGTVLLLPTGLWVLGWVVRRWRDHMVFGAVLKALAICVLPLLFIAILSLGALRSAPAFLDAGFLFFISPATAMLATEYLLSWAGRFPSQITLVLGIGLNLVVHVALYQRVRSRCLRGADAYLDRM